MYLAIFANDFTRRINNHGRIVIIAGGMLFENCHDDVNAVRSCLFSHPANGYAIVAFCAVNIFVIAILKDIDVIEKFWDDHQVWFVAYNGLIYLTCSAFYILISVRRAIHLNQREFHEGLPLFILFDRTA